MVPEVIGIKLMTQRPTIFIEALQCQISPDRSINITNAEMTFSASNLTEIMGELRFEPNPLRTITVLFDDQPVYNGPALITYNMAIPDGQLPEVMVIDIALDFQEQS